MKKELSLQLYTTSRSHCFLSEQKPLQDPGAPIGGSVWAAVGAEGGSSSGSWEQQAPNQLLPKGSPGTGTQLKGF